MIDAAAIGASGQTSASDTSAAAAAGAGASSTEFLKLLVAELRYQDPMDPKGGADFVAQLAQFAQLEQASVTNDKLGSLDAGMASGARTDMAALVGKKLSAPLDKAVVTGGGSGFGIDVTLPQAAGELSLVVRDASGHEVRRVSLGPQAAGAFTVGADVVQGALSGLSGNNFQVSVEAVDGSGKTLEVSAILDGVVDRVEFRDGGTSFCVGAAVILPGDIVAVSA